uniref:Mitochondrial fission process protein 1 n=1 Tax=Cyprinus carpio carpio TaxID=630221 RepID=A0A9J8CKE6_CYPCA
MPQKMLGSVVGLLCTGACLVEGKEFCFGVNNEQYRCEMGYCCGETECCTYYYELWCYANEVGEAFRALVPVSAVWASYAVATAYVSADALDKGRKAAAAHAEDHGKAARVAVAVVDTFVWQALASVAIPGFTINRVCAASLFLLGKTTRWPLPVRKWTTTAIGLSTIPFIITPIDRSVDFLLDSSLRKLYGEGEKHE